MELVEFVCHVHYISFQYTNANDENISQMQEFRGAEADLDYLFIQLQINNANVDI